MLYYSVFVLLLLVTQVFENWWREQERFYHIGGAGVNWHSWQMLGWGIAFAGVLLLITDVWTAIKLIIVTAGVWWIFYSGFLNLLKKRDFFYRSEESSSTLEKIAYPWVKILFLVAGFVLLFAGCSPTVRYIESVRIDTVRVVPPVIEKELPAKIITDTVIVANVVMGIDTVVDVRYYPVEKKFYVKAKPDTVKLLRVDTVSVVRVVETPPESEAWYERWYWVVLVIGVVVLIIYKVRK